MARIISSLFALCLAASAFVNAAPHQSRQTGNVTNLGNLECTTARLGIIVSLIGTGNAIQQINSTSTDPATLFAVASAQAGLVNATQGIETIALALVSGQTPPAAARDQVGNGMGTIQMALGMINETNPAVTLDLAAAQGNLTNAISAGDADVANC